MLFVDPMSVGQMFFDETTRRNVVRRHHKRRFGGFVWLEVVNANLSITEKGRAAFKKIIALNLSGWGPYR
jgi:hypothetical protein